MRLIRNPVLCHYYLTYRCNASCSFCDIWERPSPYVTLENLKKNLQDLKRLGVKVIDFTGGEPLLHRQLDKFLELARYQGFITTITTNALLYPKYADKLKGKVSMLHFSLDSSNPETHNQSRGVNCFDFVLKSIEVAKRLGERPDILFTVHSENIHEIEDVWKNICLPNQLILILNPIFDYHEIKANKLTSNNLNTLRKWAKQKNIYLNDAFLILRENGGNSTQNPVCRAASSSIVISPENELILPCYHLEIEKFAIHNQLYDLWKSQEIQQLIQQEGRYDECEGCVINCYMQPSFAVELNSYWFKALSSTLKYNWLKGTWKDLI